MPPKKKIKIKRAIAEAAETDLSNILKSGVFIL
jgi:hypothetical protein